MHFTFCSVSHVPSCNLCEPSLVIGVIGTHQPIPDVEVEPKVRPELLVVQFVVGNRVQDQSDRAPEKAAREDLDPAMPQDVEHDLPGHEQGERGWVNWDSENEQRTNSRLDEGFWHAEGVCRPGCWAGGTVMGYGAGLAVGCTTGAFFSSIASLSVSGWVFGFALAVGGS